MAGEQHKDIQVRVVEREGAGWREGPYTAHRIDAAHTVQQAVLETYGTFPGTILWVSARSGGDRLGIELWYRDDGVPAWQGANLYDLIDDGDQVDVVLVAYKPGGPRPAWPEWDARGAGTGGHDREHMRPPRRAPGVHAELLGLLRRMQRLL